MEELLHKMQEQVFGHRPVLQEIVKSHGEEILTDYIKKSWDVSKKALDPVFVKVLYDNTESVYGTGYATRITEQVSAYPLVSTVEHHGIWNHPIFVNSALIYSLHFKPGQIALALSTESVSLNNTSSWSGSLLYHKDGELKRQSFFPDKIKTLPVFSVPPITQKELTRFRKNSYEQLIPLLEALDTDNIASLQGFSLQASLLTSRLWKLAFPSAPELLYIPLESLVLNYLQKVLENKDEFLSQILLTARGRELWKKYFTQDHTFLFWAIDGRGHRQAIKFLPEGDELFSLIRKRKIYPSSTLCFAALLRAGMVCVGGFTQTTWLTQFKNKLTQLLQELGLNQDIADIPTKNFCESSLAWLKLEGKYVTPTAVDLYLSKKDFYPKYQKLAKQVTLRQSLDLATPDIYSVVVPKPEQKFDVSSGQIFKDLGLTI